MFLPGADPFPAELAERLARALLDKGPNYVPRTHHRFPNGRPEYINRLIFESSPYLLQHAHNPVNWYPWGDEAFATARRLDRPVLLSVGYSTCHWCHVMEEESFEDNAIASLINSRFIPIKVDREERPDVDGIYMAAVQLMTGSGGWPMTVVMTPDRHPWFGGTYFPPRDGDRGARVGFTTLLHRLSEVWATQREAAVGQASELSKAVARASTPEPGQGVPGPDVLSRAAAALAARFDPVDGGFGGAPKFPRPAVFDLLLRYWRRSGDPAALEMVSFSLQKMWRGGIYDQIAGGFHRYSVDAEWLVPHFEKMLYDNAQLVATLLETHQAGGEAWAATAAAEVLEYVAREMDSPSGGFTSATDADSEGHEGKYFVWTPQQLREALGADLAPTALAYYAVTERGNFEGANILWRPRPDEVVARELGIGVDALLGRVEQIKLRLRAVRARRVPPLLDDKVIVEWNGQMISAFARGGFVLAQPAWITRGARAAEFILAEMRREDRLLRTWRDGAARHRGVLEDYAFFIAALLDLFEVTGEARWLKEAIGLQQVQDRELIDREAGGYFVAEAGAADLIVREKPSYDGAQPSGNSVAALNLLRLYQLTGRPNYLQAAEAIFRALAPALGQGAVAAPKLATALDYHLDRPKQIVVVRPANDPNPELLAVLRAQFVPNRVLVIADPAGLEEISELVPFVAGKTVIEGRTTAYVCTEGVCLQPTSDPKVLRQQLEQREGLPFELSPLRIRG